MLCLITLNSWLQSLWFQYVLRRKRWIQSSVRGKTLWRLVGQKKEASDFLPAPGSCTRGSLWAPSNSHKLLYSYSSSDSQITVRETTFQLESWHFTSRLFKGQMPSSLSDKRKFRKNLKPWLNLNLGQNKPRFVAAFSWKILSLEYSLNSFTKPYTVLALLSKLEWSSGPKRPQLLAMWRSGLMKSRPHLEISRCPPSTKFLNNNFSYYPRVNFRQLLHKYRKESTSIPS